MIHTPSHIQLCAFALAVAPTAVQAQTNSPQAASRLCQVIDQTKLTTEPCNVAAETSTIWARMKLEPAEAKGFCDQLVKVIGESQIRFAGDREWRLSIRSPTSGQDSIAVCPLPR